MVKEEKPFVLLCIFLVSTCDIYPFLSSLMSFLVSSRSSLVKTEIKVLEYVPV